MNCQPGGPQFLLCPESPADCIHGVPAADKKPGPGRMPGPKEFYFQYFHALCSLFLPWKMRLYHTMAGGRTQAEGQFTAVPFTYSV